MDKINQGTANIIQTKKTVDWLVDHTKVNVFDPMTFQGYQRSIDKKHCDKIVAYLSKEFFLPTSIICASRKEYTEDASLYIVDGQHRVEALRLLRQENPARYEQIKDYQLSLIVLEKAEEEVEIDTFITINKTSKKVDTSLAYVLKNRINYNRASKDISISKREYLSVELAAALNASGPKKSELWENKILFEGAARQTPQLISLNAFVMSMRSLLYSLQQWNIIPQDWDSQEELTSCIEDLWTITDAIWLVVRNKWPDLFDSDIEKRRIIQGSIGFSSLNKYLIQNLKQQGAHMNVSEFVEHAALWIQAIQLPSSDWLPGGRFSKYSSGAGFSIIAQELMASAGKTFS